MYPITDNETSTIPNAEEALLLSQATTVPSPSESPSVEKLSGQVLPTATVPLTLTTTLPLAALTTALYTVTPEVVTSRVGRNFPPWLPAVHHHHQGTRWGPYFEGGSEPQNITARVGSTVQLDCKIGMLKDKTVSVLKCVAPYKQQFAARGSQKEVLLRTNTF